MTYPQHEKLKAAHAQTQKGVLAAFIDFLSSKDIRLASYPNPCDRDYNSGYTDDDPCNCGDEGIDCTHCLSEHTDYGYHTGWGDGQRLFPVGGEATYSKLIAEFYGIDYKAFQDEKEAMYQELSTTANARR